MSQNQHNDIPGAIAIIGLAGRFPQAKNLDEFWQNLKNGREVVRFFTKEELLSAGIDPELVDHPNYVPARAILEDAEFFDAGFFGYSPREAESIDPQQRLFLECAWEALENAGYDPDRYDGAIGVYGGLSMNSYLYTNLLANPDTMKAVGFYQVMLGNDKDFLATRASYKLNLKGPSVNVQTACSTSLVAVQMACQSLLNYQCDMALAGGVSVTMPRFSGYLYQPGMIMSPDGHCRAFDHRAQGIVSGEGVGIVVLKRYAEAVQDGDTIHAVIRGSAINNDGALKVGYTAPSVDGQAAAIMMAQAVGDVDPGSITYIEAHGTGTELGDPIEISALTQAFRTGTADKGFCAIGSVKTNMGHLDAAAGVAGLIKTVLALKHKMLPPSLNFEKPNPQIDFENTPFYVNHTLKEWKTDRLPRRAGVSSFGIGGTNAHVVLEEAAPDLAAPNLEAPDLAAPAPARRGRRPEVLLLLSARSEAALQAATENLVAWLRQHPPGWLADAAYTTQVGRKVFKHRRMLVCASQEEAITALETLDPKRVLSEQQDSQDNRVVFLFPGQGAQYVEMGRGLYENEPVFRQEVDRCAEFLQSHLGLDLRHVLYPNPEAAQWAAELINQTWITQPALFVIEYALAKLWMSWGIQPQAMAGHSIGEYVAACLANVFSLEDGLALVAARGKLMQSLPGGSMLSVPLAEAEVQPLLEGDLSLAVINAPKMCVVSGPHQSIDRLQAVLTARGVACRRLRTSHAFHSMMMEPILTPFTELVRQVSLRAPEIPYLSNLTGDWITPEQATSPSYWAAHLRSCVRFSQNIEALFQQGAVFLEVGPGQTLATLARQHAKKPGNQVILTSMRHPQEVVSDTAWITNTLGRLWLSGVRPDWGAYHAGETLRRIPLPTYPFERKRYCVEPKKAAPGAASGEKAVSLNKRKEVSSWFYLPSWRRSAWPARQAKGLERQNWLVFCDTLGLGQALVEELENQGQVVTRVLPGKGYAQLDAHSYLLSPGQEEGYLHLFQDLSARNELPTRILHLWTVTGEPDPSLDALRDIQEKGFYSLLSLLKAYGERGGHRPVALLVISNHLHEVTGGEQLDAAKVTVTGLCKVVPFEYPNLTCRSVDIDMVAQAARSQQTIVRQLLAEFDLPAGEPVVAHRGTHRWTQTYVPYPLGEVPPGELPLREQGVYLITGGYGGIGLSLAGFLAREMRARLVLVGRSGLPDRSDWQAWLDHHGLDDQTSRKIRAVQDMEACGASVLLLKADVTNPAQMRAVMDQTRAHFGRLNGVIHAAGVPAGGIIQLKSREQAEKILSPKVQGTWVLGNLLSNEPLDFLLFCSSIDSIMGFPGLADYAAANSYQDAYAAQVGGDEKPARILSINWAAWQEVGMAAENEVPAHLRNWQQDRLKNGIHPTEGFEAIKRILAAPAPQVVVSPRDLQALLEAVAPKERSEPESPAPAAEESLPSGEQPQMPGAESHSRPGSASTYIPPSTEMEKQMAAIWEDLIGIKPIGIHDNFFELGGHSLLATQILARIRDLYAVELSLRVFFETGTIAELCKRIEAIAWLERNQETLPNAGADLPSDDREEFTL